MVTLILEKHSSPPYWPTPEIRYKLADPVSDEDWVVFKHLITHLWHQKHVRNDPDYVVAKEFNQFKTIAELHNVKWEVIAKTDDK